MVRASRALLFRVGFGLGLSKECVEVAYFVANVLADLEEARPRLRVGSLRAAAWFQLLRHSSKQRTLTPRYLAANLAMTRRAGDRSRA